MASLVTTTVAGTASITATTNDGAAAALNATQSGTGRGFQVARTVASATRAMADFVQLHASGGTSPAVHIQQTTTASDALRITSDGATSKFAVTGTGQVTINQDTNTYALYIDSESTGYESISIRAKWGMYISQDIGGGYGMHITRNLNEAGSSPLVTINSDHTANTQPALHVKQDGAGYGINITQTAASTALNIAQSGGGQGVSINQDTNNYALYIDSEATGYESISVRAKYGMYISQDIGGGYGMYIQRNLNEAGSSPLANFVDDHTAGTQTTVYIRHDGSSGYGLDCVGAGRFSGALTTAALTATTGSFAGHVTPASNISYNLGSSGARWLGIYGNTANFSGAVATGAITCSTIQTSSTIAAGGTLTIANNIQILGAADGVAYSFTGDTDTGVQSGGTNTLQLTTGGTKALDFDGNQLATFTGAVVMGDFLTVNNGYSGPDGNTGYRLKFVDHGGVHNDCGIGVSGSSGVERMWFNALNGFEWNIGTYGVKLTLTSAGLLTTAGGVTVGGDIQMTTTATSSKIRFGTSSWGNNIGLESYWSVHQTNRNEGWLFRDTDNVELLRIFGSNNGTTPRQATLAGALTINGAGTTTVASDISSPAFWYRPSSTAVHCWQPKDGYYHAGGNVHTGAIRIKLPPFHDSMVTFWVDVYDYAANESFSAYISGYPYLTGGYA